jgi:hypothetical protein
MIGGIGGYTCPLLKPQAYTYVVTLVMFNPMACMYFYGFHTSSVCFVKQNAI